MLVSRERLEQVAFMIEPFLYRAKSERGVITNEDVRSALREARRAGLAVGQISSDRSCTIIESILVEA